MPVDLKESPVPEGLIARTPLTLDRVPIPTTFDDQVNLAATNVYSGRTVVLSGLPQHLPYRRILDKLAEEDYDVLSAPTFLTDERAVDELVRMEEPKPCVHFRRHQDLTS